MKTSPFPGMDPYLEAHWLDVHSSLITYARDQIQQQLPPELVARTVERVLMEADEQSASGDRHPDVYIGENLSVEPGPARPLQVAVMKPEIFEFDLESDPIKQRFIEIIDSSSGNRVITSIEFISPSNKHGTRGQRKYLQKKRECRRGRVSLVEIDLTRNGNRAAVLPIAGRFRRSKLGHCFYLGCVERSWKQGTGEIYCLPLAHALPAIKIPLRKTDEEAVLQLQPLIDQVYRNGRYWMINYQRPVAPPLPPGEAAWAAEMLKTKLN